MDHIIDNIYIGTWADADAVRKLSGWTSITTAPPLEGQEIGDYYFPLSDPGKEPMDWVWFKSAVQCLIQTEKKSTKDLILVHCQMGVNRSVSIVITYMMIKHNYSLRQAYKFLLSKRTQIWPFFIYITRGCALAGKKIPTKEEYNIIRMDFAKEFLSAPKEHILNDIFYYDKYGELCFELKELENENFILRQRNESLEEKVEELEEKLNDKRQNTNL